MKLPIVIFLSSISYLAYGQSDDSLRIKNISYKYKIINIDTIITHYRIDTKSNNTHDSVKIHADLIIEDLPIEIDSADIKSYVTEIMKINKLDLIYVFRDIFSSTLFRMSYKHAYDLLIERKGYLGEFKNK